MVRQMRLNVTLHVHWLSCYNPDRTCLLRSKTYCLNIQVHLPWKAYLSTGSSLPCTCLLKKTRSPFLCLHHAAFWEQLQVKWFTTGCIIYVHTATGLWRAHHLCMCYIIHSQTQTTARKTTWLPPLVLTYSLKVTLAFVRMTDLLIQRDLGLLLSY